MLTQEQVWKAQWYRYDYDFHENDDAVRPFLDRPVKTNWLNRAREALFLSKKSVASKLGISRQAYLKYENNEMDIKLETLSKCAEAMGCELVYAIRPKEKILFSDRIWNILNSRWPRTLYWIRVRQYYPAWRRKHGWKRNESHMHPEIRLQINARRNGCTNLVNDGFAAPGLLMEELLDDLVEDQ